MSRTLHRSLGVYWAIAPDAPFEVETHAWDACCTTLTRTAAADGRRLVLPSVVTRPAFNAPGMMSTRAVAVLVEESSD